MQDAARDTSPDSEALPEELLAPETETRPEDVPVSPRGTLPGRWQALSRHWGRLPLTMMITSLLLGLGIVQLTFQLGNIVYRSVTWNQAMQTTLRHVHGLQSDIKVLQDAEKMATDPAYLEQLARCQGFVGQNETVVVALNAPANPGSNCDTLRLP